MKYFCSLIVITLLVLLKPSGLAQPAGTRLWSVPVGTQAAPCVGRDGTVYVPNLFELDAIDIDGTKKWGCVLDGAIDGSLSISPDGTIYCGATDNNVYAINPSGSKRWAFTTGAGVSATPILGADGTIYVGSLDRNLYAIKPDGTLKWKYLTDFGIA